MPKSCMICPRTSAPSKSYNSSVMQPCRCQRQEWSHGKFDCLFGCISRAQRLHWRLHFYHYCLFLLSYCETQCRRGDLLVSSTQVCISAVLHLCFLVSPEYLDVCRMSCSKYGKAGSCPSNTCQKEAFQQHDPLCSGPHR